MLLEGQAGIVTGSAAGIGEATAKRLAAEGASVVVSDVDEAGGKRVVEEIVAAGGTASFLRTDVSDPEQVQALVDASVERYGALNIAVNNAGFGHLPTRLHELDIATFDNVLAVSLRGVFLGLKAQLAHMVEHGGGSIVNTASGTGLKGQKGLTAYVTSKHGVVGLTRTAAIDYAGDGIRVNAVAPGSILTPAMASTPQEVRDGYAQLMPSGRLGRPEEVAASIAWLLSEEASYTSGVVVPIDFAFLQS